MIILQNNRMTAFVMCALQQHLQRAEHNALQLHQMWSFRKRDGMGSRIRSRAPKTIRCRFTCRRANVNTIQKPCAKCINDKWHITLKQKQFQVCVFILGMQKKLKTKKRIKKRVWVCIFTRDFLSLCTHKHKHIWACTVVYHHLRCQ